MTLIESVTIITISVVALIALCIKTFVCSHRWKFHDTNEVYKSGSNGRPIRIYYISCCEKCGEYRKTKVSG